MADTGWLNLTTFSSVGGVTFSWTTPGNAGASDDTDTSLNVSTTAASNAYLEGVQLVSSTVPSGATINGIEVRIEAKRQATNGVEINTVQLIVGGTKSGSNLGTGTLTASDAFYTFGGATSLWGLTPTESDVNGATFGVAYRPRKTGGSGSLTHVDHMQMKIYYTEAGGGGGANSGFFNFMNKKYDDLKNTWKRSKGGLWIPELVNN